MDFFIYIDWIDYWFGISICVFSGSETSLTSASKPRMHILQEMEKKAGYLRKFLRIKNNYMYYSFCKQFSKCISISSSNKDSHRNHTKEFICNYNHDFDDFNLW